MSNDSTFIRDVGKLRILGTLARENGVTDPHLDELPYYSPTHATLTRHVNDAICTVFRPGEIIDAGKIREAISTTPLDDIYPIQRAAITEWCNKKVRPGVAFPRYGDIGSVSVAWGIALLIDEAFSTETQRQTDE
jgi:hypothetical protein